MSSSTDSQWIPTPRPIGCQDRRCSGVAPRNLGNHWSGAAMVRPSASFTRSSSSVHSTATTRASSLGTEELMPPLQEVLHVLGDDSFDSRKFRDLAVVGVVENDRHEPELRDAV